MEDAYLWKDGQSSIRPKGSIPDFQPRNGLRVQNSGSGEVRGKEERPGGERETNTLTPPQIWSQGKVGPVLMGVGKECISKHRRRGCQQDRLDPHPGREELKISRGSQGMSLLKYTYTYILTIHRRIGAGWDQRIWRGIP